MQALIQDMYPSAFRVGGCELRSDGVHLLRWTRLTIMGHQGRAAVTDLPAFRTELVALLPRLRRFALTLARNAADGDDLVQSTCERAILRCAQWQPGTRLDSWLFTMMRNLWTSEIRSRRVRFGTGQVEATEANDLSTPVGPADHAYGNELIAMIFALPEGLSATLLLVSIEGHSYQETAEILGIPIGTVMSRMSKARQLVKEWLIETGGRATT